MKKFNYIDQEAQHNEVFGAEQTEREVKEETKQNTIMQMILRHYE